MPFANADISDIIATTIQSRSGVIADNIQQLAYLKVGSSSKYSLLDSCIRSKTDVHETARSGKSSALESRSRARAAATYLG